MKENVSMENISNEKKEKKSIVKKEKKSIVKIVLVSILAVLIIGIVTFLLVFHVKKVEVIGNTRYTEEEIKSMALTKFYSSNAVLVTWLDGNQEVDGIPFINGFKIEEVSHNEIRIIVSEKQIIGYLKDDDKNTFFDKDGVVVEVVEVDKPKIVDGKQVIVGEVVDDKELIKPQEVVEAEVLDETVFHAAVTNVPLIEGLEASNIALNQKMKVADLSVFNTIWGITRMVERFNIQPDKVVFEADESVTMHYDNVRVLIGDDSLLEEKIARVAAILPNLVGKSGELHLKDYKAGVDTIVFSSDVIDDKDDEESEEATQDDEMETGEELEEYEENGEYEEYEEYGEYEEYEEE